MLYRNLKLLLLSLLMLELFCIKAMAQAPSYENYKQRVVSLHQKIEEKKGLLQSLVKEKEATSDVERLSELLGDIVTEHKELKRLEKEYDQTSKALRYHFPAKGQKVFAQLKSGEKVDSVRFTLQEESLQTQLDAIKEKILAKYQFSSNEKNSTPLSPLRSPASSASPPEQRALPDVIRVEQ